MVDVLATVVGVKTQGPEGRRPQHSHDDGTHLHQRRRPARRPQPAVGDAVDGIDVIQAQDLMSGHEGDVGAPVNVHVAMHLGKRRPLAEHTIASGSSRRRSALRTVQLKNGAKGPTDWRFQAALVVSRTPIAQLLSRPHPRKLAASSMIASRQCSLRAAMIWLAVNLERIIALASKQRKSLFSECLPPTEIYADRRKAEVNQWLLNSQFENQIVHTYETLDIRVNIGLGTGSHSMNRVWEPVHKDSH